MDPGDPRSQHVFHFLDMVERVHPKAFVMENVKSLYQSKRWEDVRRRLLERADTLGYNTALTLVNAAHFGVPQSRERMLFLGVHKDVGQPVAPVPTTPLDSPTVREALAQLSPYGKPGNNQTCRSPYAGMLFNGGGRPLDLDAPSLTLAASIGGNLTPIIDQLALENENAEPWVVGYHTALLNRGANASTRNAPDPLRRLTVEEAAAIQTFPLNMEWQGPQSSRYRQIGNAVPPRLALAAAEAVKQALHL
jgi:DNA (cytosine-5)-methyltransferase 1